MAGRLSSRVPVRLLIGPGLSHRRDRAAADARPRTRARAWTHLIPGMIVGGIGVGLVNPPLASTAVGVVAPGSGPEWPPASTPPSARSGPPPGYRPAGDAVLQRRERRGADPHGRGRPGLVRPGAGIAGAVQSGQIGNGDRTAARARPGRSRGTDHPGRLHHRAGTASCWSRRSSRSWQASYRWPLSAAGTSPAPRPAVRKAPEMRRPGRAGSQPDRAESQPPLRWPPTGLAFGMTCEPR